MTRDYLTSIDTAMLQLEDPTNLMMVTGVMIFKSPIDFERLRATVEARFAGLKRFQQRLTWSRLGVGAPYWKDDPDFDIGYHVQRATLPPPGDQAALQDVVSLLASTPLDLARPLWQFHLIENYTEGCALVMRFHHSIGDGSALMHVILSLTDSRPDATWPVVRPEHLQRDRADRPGIRGQPADPDRKAGRSPVSTLLRDGYGLLAEPERMAELGRTGRDAAAELGRFLLHKPDPDTVLNGELGVDKRAAWSTGTPLGEVKAIQQALGGTVNDVLLTVVTGALRRYMEHRGEPVDSIAIRTAVPVNLRPASSEGELGNRVGAVFVTLPISIADPACRLSEIVRRMNDQKDSLEAPAFYVALSALGQTPARLANTLIKTFSTRATTVMTNMRGPQQRLYLAGAPVEALLPWAPTTGRMGVAVSILSYAGEVRLGLLTDKGLVPDPELIIDAFHAEFEALLARARSSAP